MVVKCEVKFDNNPNGIFFSGQTLSGVVELTIDKSIQIRGLKLKIEGAAKVEWSETANNQNNQTPNSRTIFYSGNENFLSSTSYLIGNEDEGSEIDLAPGHYRYNFQSLLPPQLPTSMEASYGAIRYLVSVVLDRAYKFDLTYKLAFTVIKPLDLNNENLSLQLPQRMEVMKTFCYSICQSKPIFLSVTTPNGGYVPGQAILATIHINNESRYDIEDVKVSFNKIVRYTSHTPTVKTKENVTTELELNSGGVKRRSHVNFTQRIFIPAVSPTNTNYCHVLNVSYELQVKCKVSVISATSSDGPSIKLPIVIGTIPINQRHVNTPIPLQSLPSQIELTYDQMLNPYTPQIDNSTSLPPSYAEAIYTQEEFGNSAELSEDGEHVMGSIRPFRPMYPVYYSRDEFCANPSLGKF